MSYRLIHRLLLIGGALSVILACNLTSPTPASWARSQPTPTLPPSPSPTPYTPSPGARVTPATASPTLRPIPNVPLTEIGPWLLVLQNDGLLVMNPDGSGQIHLAFPGLIDVHVSPVDGFIALRTREKPGADQVMLRLVKLPEGRVELVTTMSSPAPAKLLSPRDERAISWSPDGRFLAFEATPTSGNRRVTSVRHAQSTHSTRCDG